MEASQDAMTCRLSQLVGSPPGLGMGLMMLTPSLAGSCPTLHQELNWAVRAVASCGTAALRNQGGRLPATDLRPLMRLASAETSATRKGRCMLAASDARWRVRRAGLLCTGPGCWAAGSLLLPADVCAWPLLLTAAAATR